MEVAGVISHKFHIHLDIVCIPSHYTIAYFLRGSLSLSSSDEFRRLAHPWSALHAKKKLSWKLKFLDGKCCWSGSGSTWLQQQPFELFLHIHVRWPFEFPKKQWPCFSGRNVLLVVSRKIFKFPKSSHGWSIDSRWACRERRRWMAQFWN